MEDGASRPGGCACVKANAPLGPDAYHVFAMRWSFGVRLWSDESYAKLCSPWEPGAYLVRERRHALTGGWARSHRACQQKPFNLPAASLPVRQQEASTPSSQSHRRSRIAQSRAISASHNAWVPPMAARATPHQLRSGKTRARRLTLLQEPHWSDRPSDGQIHRCESEPARGSPGRRCGRRLASLNRKPTRSASRRAS